MIHPQVKLDEAFWFQEGPGVRKWQFTDHGIKLLNVGNILKTGVIDLAKTDRHLSEDEVWERYSHFLADAGDLVMASSGISIDDDGLLRTRSAFVKEEHLPLCMNTSTIRFKAIDGLSNLGFLKHWLQSREFRIQITREVTGIAQKNFGPSHLKRLHLSLPPLAEQKRIARILDAADALRARRRETLAQLDTFLQSTFLDMFGDPRLDEGPHLKVPLAQIAEITMGQSPPGSTYNHSGEGTPLLNGPTEFGVRFPKEVQWTTSPTRLCKDGDIVFCVRGATAGRLNEADKEYCLGRGVAAIRGIDPGMNPFIFAVLRSLYDYFQSKGVGSTFINISRKDLEALPFPNPPLDLQRRFATIVDSVEQQKVAQRAHLAELDTLFASLQSRAFRGDL